jgi:hypothetical protein
MSAKKVMHVIDPRTGMMECEVCGSTHLANLRRGGHFYRGAWQCQSGCQPTPLTRARRVAERLDDTDAVAAIEALIEIAEHTSDDTTLGTLASHARSAVADARARRREAKRKSKRAVP